MPRHSKNNTALGFFTYAEKQKLKYGTQKERIGRDSMRNFDACYLCLQTAREPMSCGGGHIACKECIYDNILAQKKDHEIRLKEWKAKALLERMAQDEKKTLVERELRLSMDNPTSSSSKKKRGASDDTAISEKRLRIGNDADVSSTIKEKIAEDLKRNSKIVEKEQEEKGKSKLPSFWIPELTPSTNESLGEEPKLKITCSLCDIPISLKKLYPVKFSYRNTNDDNMNEKKPHCMPCMKTINNTMQLCLMRRCGHVIRASCVEQFVRKTMTCYVCEKKCKEKDIIPLQKEGTGYAAGGSALVKKAGVAFQC